MNTELRDFVRDALARGQSREAIQRALAGADWPADEIDAELSRWADVEFPVPVPRRKPSLSARESFLYLVLFATLYIAAYNSAAILFEFVDRLFPDALRRGLHDLSNGSLRMAVASLVIALPVFLYTQRLIARSVARDPAKRASGVRRWLTYLTLFVTALVLIGDFVAVVSGLLSGELVPRFLIKCLVVFTVAAVVFRHYLADLRRDEVAAPADVARVSRLGRVGVAGMAVVAIAGLIVAGSPGQARLQQIDQRRVQNLERISAALESWRDKHGALPDALGALRSAPSPRFAGMSLSDPQTEAPYVYVVKDSLTYELCATFAGAAFPDPARGQDPFWRHPAGRHCFEIRLPPRPPSAR